MKYLFFDIECSNNFNKKSKMCEFGYVITDENFKVLKKGDIPMSPGKNTRGNRFDEGVYKRDPKFQWAYDYDYYFSCPEFPYYHEMIKQLFEDKDTIVFGFSIDNDIHYLNATLERYNLDLFNYDAYDIQSFLRKYLKDNKSVGLEKAFKTMCPINEFVKLQTHLPRDDAYMTMRVFQEICKNTNKTSLELIDEYKSSKINSIDFHKGHIKRMEETQTKEKGRIILNEFYEKYESLVDNQEYVGKIINISREMQKNPELLNEIISLTEEKGFIGCKLFSKSNYIIALNAEDVERLERALNKYSIETKILIYDDFIKDIARVSDKIV